ncbi:MAG TPA: hypothetical protein VG842_10775, partial [Sediminibacterium sp.]|nr:hypothetical protein [Sediminibacterium sp.]
MRWIMPGLNRYLSDNPGKLLFKKSKCLLTGICILCCMQAGMAQTTLSAVPDSSFTDTSGGYHFMYLTTNCFECSPKSLVYY